jgi:hypothetical protein
MDQATLTRNLFSRGGSPQGAQSPASQSQSAPQDTSQTLPPQMVQSSVGSQPPYQHVSPAQSLREVPVSSPKRVDQLFQNMTPPAQQPSAASISSFQHGQLPQSNGGHNSGAGTPVSITAQSVGSSSSAPAHQQSASRESALLSLLGTVSPPAVTSVLHSQQQHQQQHPSSHQQIPTPPGSLPANNENQGRMLLEQIMHGSVVFSFQPVSPVICAPRFPHRTMY